MDESTDPTMLSNQTYRQEIWTYKSIKKEFLFTMSSFFVMGCVGNLLIIIFYPQKQRHFYITNFFIRKLALVDLCACVCVIPYSILFEAHMVWSVAACKIMEFIRYFTVAESLLTLVCVCIERYWAVCLPLKVPTSQQAWYLIIAVTVISLVLAAPALAIYTVLERSDTAFPGLVFHSCYLRRDLIFVLIYNLLLLLTFFGATVSMFVLYGKVFVTIIRRVKRVAPKYSQNPKVAVLPGGKPMGVNGKNVIDARQNVNKAKDGGGGDQNTHFSSATQPSSHGSTRYLEVPSEKSLRAKGRRNITEVRTNEVDTGSSKSASLHKDYEELHQEEDKSQDNNQVNGKQTVPPYNLDNSGEHNDTYKPSPTSPQVNTKQLVEDTPNFKHNIQHSQLSDNKRDLITTLHNNTHIISNIRAHARLAVMLFGISLIFVLSWVPFWLQKLRLVPYNALLHYLFFFNNSSNFIVYLAFNQTFRTRLTERFYYYWKQTTCNRFTQRE